MRGKSSNPRSCPSFPRRCSQDLRSGRAVPCMRLFHRQSRQNIGFAVPWHLVVCAGISPRAPHCTAHKALAARVPAAMVTASRRHTFWVPLAIIPPHDILNGFAVLRSRTARCTVRMYRKAKKSVIINLGTRTLAQLKCHMTAAGHGGVENRYPCASFAVC